jgi:hypothetical protein
MIARLCPPVFSAQVSVARSLRKHVTATLPLYVFLGVYFLTTTLANVLYATPIGRSWPSRSITDFNWEMVPGTFGPEFWLLLLVPFAVVPSMSLLTRRTLQRPAGLIAALAVEFPKTPYAILTAALYLYVIHAMIDAGAAGLMTSGTNAIDAVEARFEVLMRLGFWPQMVMQSLLTFLAVYALVSASRQGGWFWYLAALWHITALTACLILLNMKWPVVLFIFTLAVCVLVVARRFAVIKSASVFALGVATYLLMSVVLLRLVPAPPDAIATGSPSAAIATGSPSATPLVAARPDETRGPAAIAADPEYLMQAVVQSREQASTLVITALNRMAVAVPFYYSVFSREGLICGTILDRLVRKPSPCQPSNVIYARMFGDDGFGGRATAPAAVQISGYALGGWLGVLVGLLATGIAIGAFLVLWPAAQRSNMVATAFVMGGYAAYFWTQLPFEAALVYSHGLLWWAGLVFIQTFVMRLSSTRSQVMPMRSR